MALPTDSGAGRPGGRHDTRKTPDARSLNARFQIDLSMPVVKDGIILDLSDEDRVLGGCLRENGFGLAAGGRFDSQRRRVRPRPPMIAEFGHKRILTVNFPFAASASIVPPREVTMR